MTRILFLFVFVFPFILGIISAQNGNTRVAKWKDDKQAAISLGFDDSQWSQLDNAVPNLESRGLTAVFYVNQGKYGYTSRESEWLGILNRGQHLAPHTMTHSGSTSYADALYEIGRSAELVWDAYGVPYHSMLLSYASGGGVTWSGITRQQRLDIDDSFNLINRYHFEGCSTCSNPEHWHSDRMPHSVNMANYSGSSLVNKVDNSVSQGAWEHFYGHGVGDGHSTSLSVFITLVNYLESIENNIWNASYIDAFKYDMERFSANVEVLESTNDLIKIRLSSDISASGFIVNDINLYDEPLTLITQVPWEEVTVTQGSSSNTHTANNGEVMYVALPNVGTTNRGDIILQQSGGLPVELTSFSASVKNSLVTLNWTTITELNNYGFEVERQISTKQSAVDNWEMIGFVEGNGNSNRPINYIYIVKTISTAGIYSYRLKQIDTDGSFTYSQEIVVTVEGPNSFSLGQNYPNPFNPTTNIGYTISNRQFVSLKVYDVLGNEIATLVNEEKPADNYEVRFSAISNEGTVLPSGIYFFQLKAGGPSTSSGQGFVETKKMVLLR